MDRRDRSHPSRCTSACDDMRIVCMVLLDCAATSRIIAQQTQSVIHYSVSARTIRRRLQRSGMSTRRSLHRLPSTENYGRLRCQWYNEWQTWTT
ncbi:transposable element Tcb1 transposase [Trichonephila clavipes]|nr:transposable element Tcb1 transposase [Trichonephila clavipes]GFU38735.1 transposable element Tcb1 transposase [Trichonephila clavipes]